MSDGAIKVKDGVGYLNVNEKTVYRLAQCGELPGSKVAGAWRFRRRDIDAEINQQKMAATSPAFGSWMSFPLCVGTVLHRKPPALLPGPATHHVTWPARRKR